MDPAVLNAGADAVRRAVRKVLDAYGSGSGHVFNLGHGIPPTAKIENVAAMIETIHNYC
jgi:uroporphyrinogen decarboxylase